MPVQNNVETVRTKNSQRRDGERCFGYYFGEYIYVYIVFDGSKYRK
jgi:hypothetical protein